MNHKHTIDAAMRLHNFIVQFRVLSLLYSPLVVFVSLLMARGKQESVEVKQKWEVCVSLQHELYRNPFVDKNHRLWIAISLYFPLCYLYVNVFHYFGFVAKAVSKDSISIAMVFSKGLCNDWLSTDSPTIQEYVSYEFAHLSWAETRTGWGKRELKMILLFTWVQR